MFHKIPRPILKRMQALEEIDARDRVDGTPRMERLRQIRPSTGKFLAILAAGAPEGDFIEIGASAGYSTLWLALAARHLGRKITTFEVLPEKVALARETYARAGVEDVVELVAGDARDHLPGFIDVAFCFLDAEKEVYGDCYDIVVPRLAPRGLLAADNAINHRETLQPVLDRAHDDARVAAVVVPIDNGVLLCRKL